MRPRSALILFVLALVAVAGCGRLTRTATLNQTSQIPGPVAESAHQQHIVRFTFKSTSGQIVPASVKPAS